MRDPEPDLRVFALAFIALESGGCRCGASWPRNCVDRHVQLLRRYRQRGEHIPDYAHMRYLPSRLRM